MEIWQTRSKGGLSYPAWDPVGAMDPDLLLVFGGVGHFERAGFMEMLRGVFPRAAIAGCSTAGEITREGVLEDHVVLTALRFQHPAFRVVTTPLDRMEDCAESGRRLGEHLRVPFRSEPLRGVLLLGLGVKVNGSAIIQGLAERTGPEVPICGALAGDGGAFIRTYTISDEGVSSHCAVAVGFYGEAIRLRTGSAGGWLPFGPVRRITRASHNVLYELDREPALDVYRRYLGEWAKDLPESGLLFPICVLDGQAQATGLIRTLLGIDETSKSLILAGDVQEHADARFMHADTEGLLEGARAAARSALGGGEPPDLALLFSCVGRKLVLGGRVDQEVEAVAEELQGGPVLAGFYSYGEIGPMGGCSDSRLHNQTMTVTLLSERA